MAIFSNDSLKNKHILVTGATGGIGAATAKILVSMGAKVTITGRNEKKLQQLKMELEDKMNTENVAAIKADMTKEGDLQQLIQQADEKNGFIYGLVNSAGIGGGSPVIDLAEDVMRDIMELNYFATFRLTQLIYQKMVDKKQGNIVNISSLSGLRGTHGNSAYAASKFAVIGWTHSMALEAIEHNIRVNAVCPGYVDTEMARNSMNRKGARKGLSPDEAYEEALNSIPSGRLTEPEEVANTVAFLLTDAAENIVGESLKISGGNVMR